MKLCIAFLASIFLAFYATLDGVVTLQGVASVPPGTSITVRIGYRYYAAPVRPDGSFTISGLRPGTYSIRVKHSNHLATKRDGVVLLPGITTAIDFGLQLAGDADNNNVVNDADFTILQAAYQSAPGIPNWDERADFNLDGMVNGADFSLMATNYGQVGSP